MTSRDHPPLFLITGGSGFIGSHIAAHLHANGERVRILDKAPLPEFFEKEICAEYIQGNLCLPEVAALAVRGVHTVLHLAANMGGMGAIHAANDFVIYKENKEMTCNILQASISAGVARFFFASSACVYPAHLQSDVTVDTRLKEIDAWSFPSPQGLYGLEKLEGELMVQHFNAKFDQVRIGRFHNVYGPGGSWRGGREKAPAALARKAVVAQMEGTRSPVMEMWGDGTQRRSFLYIDDCVRAVMLLLERGNSEPINIGSDESVTIADLARMAGNAAGLEPRSMRFAFDTSKPVGVSSRNSDNARIGALLGWTPSTTTWEGMKRTVDWVRGEIEGLVTSRDMAQRIELLSSLRQSCVVQMQNDRVVFAILLPITSRGSLHPSDCLENLTRFSSSLARTIWGDVDRRFHIKVYLGIDHDDEFLRDGDPARNILNEGGIWDISTVTCSHPRGQVCAHWRTLAHKAWKDDCHYLVLFGDDVELLDYGWMRDVHDAFVTLAQKTDRLAGFGCVALDDISFPGMPTFPVVHRTHMEIFGEVIPPEFINQDGDPFLFQLYRRFGASTMIRSRVRNAVGGSGKARYEKRSLSHWTLGILDTATGTIEKWLLETGYAVDRLVTLDVVIPSYRVDLKLLVPILELKPSATASIMFIVIIDDPNSSNALELKQKYGHRPDVRIRINKANLGASASRNRGLDESAAEWVHFLDDDVQPQPNLLVEAEKMIRTHPNAAGFVGNMQFPAANTIFTTAIHLSNVTYFWDIAQKWKSQSDLPWGVTASLLVRRDTDMRFNLSFPKTGGGEDIDFCVRKRDESMARGKEGFWPAPNVVATHPWWNNGRRTYRRFYGWSKGDGSLAMLFPQHSYTNRYPTAAEKAFICAIVVLVGISTTLWSVARLGVEAFIAAMLANIIHDVYREISRDSPETRSTVTGLAYGVAVLESSFIRMVSESGRLVGQIERWEVGPRSSAQRFDWFVGRAGNNPVISEKKCGQQRFFMWVVFLLAIHFTNKVVGRHVYN